MMRQVLQEDSESDMSLQNRFNRERDRASNAAYSKKILPKISAEPVTDDEYKAECSVLPKGSVDSVSGMDLVAWVPDDYMLRFFNGQKCCIAILPFADNGSDKASLVAGGRWIEFIRNKNFFRAMQVYFDGRTERFNGDIPAYYYDLLPEILRKDISEGGCTFEINYDEPRKLNNPKDRQKFIDQCEQALQNLQKFFGRGFGSKDKHGPH